MKRLLAAACAAMLLAACGGNTTQNQNQQTSAPASPGAAAPAAAAVDPATAATVTILTDLGPALLVSVILLAQSGRLAAVVLVFVTLHALSFPYFLRKIRATGAIIRAKM